MLFLKFKRKNCFREKPVNERAYPRHVKQNVLFLQ